MREFSPRDANPHFVRSHDGKISIYNKRGLERPQGEAEYL